MAAFSSLLLGAALLASLPAARATPSLDFPISEQYPPVARVDSAYSFTLSSYTFTTSSGGSLNYSVTNLPSWASFDSSSLVISGTPTSDSDVGYAAFELVATDSADDSTATDSASLAIASTTPPSVKLSCYSQLEQNYSSYTTTGIALIPEASFSIQFSADTFSGNVTDIYGLYEGMTPLPSWISFDSSSLTFNGNAPAISSNIAPPLSYEFLLVATDISGYSAVESAFTIDVGEHSLIAESATVNATDGTKFSVSLTVTLDGADISSSNISSVSVNGTSDWMSFDDSTLTLTGTPDSSDNSTEVTVVITDVYGDESQTTIEVVIASSDSDSVFASSAANVTATRGQDFNYTLDFTSEDSIADVNLAYYPTSASTWLSYDNSTFTLSGTVPGEFDSVEVEITATTTSDDSETESFYIVGTGAMITTTSKTASSTATSTGATSSATKHATTTTTASSTITSSMSSASASSTVVAVAATTKTSNTRKIAAIACGVIIPVAVILALVVLYFCCCAGYFARRRGRRESSITAVDAPTSRDNISKPIPIEDQWPLDAPSKPAKSWYPDRRMSAMSLFSNHRRSYSDLEKEPHTEVSGFVIPFDPDDSRRPHRSQILSQTLSRARDSLASLATIATTELFSLRAVENSHGDISGLARSGSGVSTDNRDSYNRINSRGSDYRRHSAKPSGGSAGSATIGQYSASSINESPTRLGAVREEDISDGMHGLVKAPRVEDDGSSYAGDDDRSSRTNSLAHRFELVPGAREWRERQGSRDEMAEGQPRLVNFTNGGRPASRGSVGHDSSLQAGVSRIQSISVREEDGQVFL
ncbi:uncharacterized protein V1518DRAFT_422384 [Limtongia smithiae]|uniref:uncharacterized protein n=1 Tax=Limtongia smithiae TaxID=1125753 RepID=UPI0034CD1DD8